MAPPCYFDTIPLEVYSRIWTFLLVVDKPRVSVGRLADLNVILSFMLTHKRAKAAFESVKGWSLYSNMLFLEDIRLDREYNGAFYSRPRCNDRVALALSQAMRIAVERDLSKQLNDTCEKALRKRKIDEVDGNIPAWVRRGVWVEDQKIVGVDCERRIVTIERRIGSSITRSDIFIDEVHTYFPYGPSLDTRLGYGTRVQVIAGDFEGLVLFS